MAHIHELMAWFPDEPSIRVWGGPVFRYPFTEESFLHDVHWERMATFVLADERNAMVGFGQLYNKVGRAHLARLVVSPSQRGKGNGSALVRLLIDKGCELFPYTENSLYVMRTNERAMRCYLKFGFEEVPMPHGERVHPDQVFMVRK